MASFLKLGIHVSKATVSKHLLRRSKTPSPTWRSFLNNHVRNIAAIDFFTMSTATFRILYVFIVLRHDRRRIVHVNATEHPTSCWTAQQMIEAFPFDSTRSYVIRDRDSLYGSTCRNRVANMGIDQVLIAPRSPSQNPYVERAIGSIRREYLDHVIIINERHLRRILRAYFEYYHDSHTHLSLGEDPPDARTASLKKGDVVSLPKVGGLHHRYERLAA